jgi:hypothetical protein
MIRKAEVIVEKIIKTLKITEIPWIVKGPPTI